MILGTIVRYSRYVPMNTGRGLMVVLWGKKL
jgi:hypothetical protein